MLGQRPAEHPGDDPGNDPDEQRQRFLDEATLETDQTGNGDNGNDRPIDPGKGHGIDQRRKRACILAEHWAFK
ncbi:hypothetical protein D3C77_685720 [compost metagenome]